MCYLNLFVTTAKLSDDAYRAEKNVEGKDFRLLDVY
jgi:hypothetical protein